jgi:hypothetical protein
MLGHGGGGANSYRNRSNSDQIEEHQQQPALRTSVLSQYGDDISSEEHKSPTKRLTGFDAYKNPTT